LRCVADWAFPAQEFSAEGISDRCRGRCSGFDAEPIDAIEVGPAVDVHHFVPAEDDLIRSWTVFPRDRRVHAVSIIAVTAATIAIVTNIFSTVLCSLA
jgi:hypothetical protein